MAWTMPRTWVPGEMVDAALLNQQLRDNLAHLVPNVTPVDVAYSASLWSGLSGMTWTVQSGDVQWQWYYRFGQRLTFSMGVQATSVGGSLGSSLTVQLPVGTGQFVAVAVRVARFLDNSVDREILIGSLANLLTLSRADGANFVASTNATLAELTVDCVVAV